MSGRQTIAAADGMGRGAIARRVLRGTVLLAASLALLAPGAVQDAGAEDKNASGAGTANVLVCEAAGGEAEVVTGQNAAGWQFVSVSCNGGYLDGWECFHSTDAGTWNCNSARVVPSGGETAPTGEFGVVAAAFQSGSPKQIDNAVAAALEAGGSGDLGTGADAGGNAPAADADASASPNDRGENPRPKDKAKGKHGKHGGKAGKLRNR